MRAPLVATPQQQLMAGAALHTSQPAFFRTGQLESCKRILVRLFQGHAGPRSARCRARQSEDELQLVRREETNDGAILFVFGDEAAVAAAQQQEEADEPPVQQAAPAPEEPAVEPEPVMRAPSTEEAPGEPEAAYEAARTEQVVEAAAEEGGQAGPEAGPGAAAEEAQEQHATEQQEQQQQQQEAASAANGGLVPCFDDPGMDPDEALSDEDAPDLQDEIAKTLTSLRVADLKAMCKERNITGYSKYRKSQLVRVLKDAMLVEME